MGFFGLFWTMFMISGKTINKIKNSIEDSNNKDKSLDGIMYYDHKSRRRLVSNNHFCFDEFKDGYRRIIDTTTMKVVWDARDTIIPNNIEKYKKDAIQKGRTTYRCDGHNDQLPGYDSNEIYGHQYADIETGRIFVIRTVDSSSFGFFVDIITNRAIRYTDYTLNWLKEMEIQEQKREKEYKTKGKMQKYIKYSLIDSFKQKHQGRNPIEEYNYRMIDSFWKISYDLKRPQSNCRFFEQQEEKFENKER